MTYQRSSLAAMSDARLTPDMPRERRVAVEVTWDDEERGIEILFEVEARITDVIEILSAYTVQARCQIDKDFEFNVYDTRRPLRHLDGLFWREYDRTEWFCDRVDRVISSAAENT